MFMFVYKHSAQSVLAKALKNAVLARAGVQARAGVVAGARADLGINLYASTLCF